jgi:hypothetical protein
MKLRFARFATAWWLAASIIAVSACPLIAADLEVRLQPSRSQTDDTSYDNFQVVFLEDKRPSQKLIVSPAVTAAASYELIGKKGNDLTPLEIASVRAVPKGGTAMRLVFIPKEKPKIDKFEAFQLRPKDAATWKFTDGSTYHYPKGSSFAALDTKVLQANSNYYRRFSGFQNHFDTGHNLDGGVLSLEVHYEARTSEESTAQDAYLFLFNAKGDFVFPTKEKTSFFNSLSADLEYVYSHLPDTAESSAPAGAPFDPHNLAPPKNRWEPFWDLGLSAKYESDQSFDNVNLLVGVVGHLIARNPITDSIQEAILMHGPLFLNPRRLRVATIAPLFTFRYDYVNNVKDSKEVDTGQNRFTGALFYRLPLAREIDLLKRTGLTQQVFDSDFVAELEVVYDFDKQKVANNSKLTLEILPHSGAQNQPAFILTYAQGKATPTFQHFDAFLAGLKIPF